MPLINNLTECRFLVISTFWRRRKNVFESDAILELNLLNSLFDLEFGPAIILASEF
jgi:hypothetical protein